MQENLVAALAILIGAALLGSPTATSQDQQSVQQLPRAVEIPGVKPEVLAKTEVPSVPGRLLIVSRTTYQPGARVRKHYHTGEVTFYILDNDVPGRRQGTLHAEGGGFSVNQTRDDSHALEC